MTGSTAIRIKSEIFIGLGYLLSLAIKGHFIIGITKYVMPVDNLSYRIIFYDFNIGPAS
jgi:hypothetical protein